MYIGYSIHKSAIRACVSHESARLASRHSREVAKTRVIHKARIAQVVILPP